MKYKLFTPPWMKGTVHFVYGPTRSKTIPCTTEELPRKDILRGAGKNPLVCAIIYAWVKIETSSASYILFLLALKNIRLHPESVLTVQASEFPNTSRGTSELVSQQLESQADRSFTTSGRNDSSHSTVQDLIKACILIESKRKIWWYSVSGTGLRLQQNTIGEAVDPLCY